MLNISELAQKFKSCNDIDLFFEEKLSEHTSFKIGGAAALFAEPRATDALCLVMNIIRQEQIPYFVLGGGTNVVFADEGFEGIVVSTKKIDNGDLTINNAHATDDREHSAARSGELSTFNFQLSTLNCSSGASTASVVNFAAENGVCGLEEFAGLPGTVGGAVYMNARCFEKEISDVAGKISWIEYDGKRYVQKEKVFEKSEWSYKKSPFTGSDKIITAVEFVLPNTIHCANKEQKDLLEQEKLRIKKRCQDFVRLRKEKGHFEFPCAGSVFKNDHAFGEPTGKIIESLGLKGKKIGGAEIAPFHGNIIINTGGATCRDVRALVEFAKREALEKRGFALEEEIVFVNVIAPPPDRCQLITSTSNFSLPT